MNRGTGREPQQPSRWVTSPSGTGSITAQVRESTPSGAPKKVARLWRTTTALFAVLTLLVGAGWAYSVVFASKPVVTEQPFTVVTAERDTLEDSRVVNVRAECPRSLAAANLAVGTITAITELGTTPLPAGTILYHVDLSPIVLMQGSVPSFRGLTQGAEGQDVAQLQAYLVSAGYLESYDEGEWGYSTTRAVRAWQRAIGMPDDGTLEPGDIVFVPTLPAVIIPDPSVIKLGARLGGGEEALLSACPIARVRDSRQRVTSRSDANRLARRDHLTRGGDLGSMGG